MKKLITAILIAFSISSVAQTMLVTKTTVTPDPLWQFMKSNFQPLSDLISQEISNSTVEGDSVRAEELIKVKRKCWNAIRDFRNNTVDSVIEIGEVDSLKTMQIIDRNTAEIKALKRKMDNCSECDTEVLQGLINTLQNQRNEARKNSKNWVRKNEIVEVK